MAIIFNSWRYQLLIQQFIAISGVVLLTTVTYVTYFFVIHRSFNIYILNDIICALQTIQNVDALFDNLSSEENREETLNTYFEKQTNAIANLNIGRTKDLKDQVDLFSKKINNHL